MTITQRMYALMLSAFVGLVGLALLGALQMQRVFTAADYVSVNVVPSIISLNKVIADFGNVRAATWQLLARARWEAVLIALLVIAAVAAQGLLTTRRLIKSLREAGTIAETVAAGDLRVKIDVTSKDEIGKLLQALKNMNDGLVRIVGQMRQGTQTITSATAEIAQSNLDLSARTESQSSTLEETAASMEQLYSTVKHSNDNVRQANQLAQSASALAVKGGAVVSQVVETMSGINASSREIASIIGTIDDSVGKVAAGSRLVGEAGTTMSEVVAGIKRVHDIVAEISSASNEQLAGIGQVNEAVVAMDSTTQQNAALVEEAAAAAKSLQDQTVKLNEVVNVFKLDASHAPSSSSTRLQRPALRPAPVAPATPPSSARRPPALRLVTANRAGAQNVEAWETF
jgi:methyl-accepting chemotaxis protein